MLTAAVVTTHIVNENIPWSVPEWRWPGRFNANRELLTFIRGKAVELKRERHCAASILAGLASLAELDPLVRIALDSDELLRVRVDCVRALRRLSHEGARLRPVDVHALLSASSNHLTFCCCEMCSAPGGELYLPLVVSACCDRDSLQLVFRRLENIDPVRLLVALERMEATPATKLVAWLADRATRDPDAERRVVAALAARALGVASDIALELDSPRDPWTSVRRIALRLDALDRPYLDVDRFVDAFGARFERSVRDSLLAASFGSARAPRHLYAVLAAMPQGFELAARLLDDMTLGTDQVVALVMVMFEQNRDASLRWLARRGRQPQLRPALRRVAHELERLHAAPDFVAAARSHLPALGGESFAVEQLDLTTQFRRVFEHGGVHAFVDAALAAEGIRPAKRRAPLPWISQRRGQSQQRIRGERLRGAG